MTERPEDALDRAIESGAAQGDAEIGNMARTAVELQDAFSVEAPPAADVQAMFVEGVAAATARPPYRRLVAGIAVASVVLLAVVIASRDALPGHTLYSVRQALDSVGLADSPAREAARRLDKAASLVETAEAMPPSERAQALAVEAIGELGVVRELAEGIEPKEAATEVLARVARLEQRAARVIAASGSDEDDEGRAEDDDRSGRDDGPGGDNGGEDRSGSDDGPGDGDDDGRDDHTGPGGGDDGSGDDRSGGDDGGGEDDTDDGDGDDSSGPGGEDDDGDDDRSETDSSGNGSDDAEDASDD